MFKEKYIKDNNLIKPDDAFLERLKETVGQEDNVVHIGEYIDLDDVKSLHELQDSKEIKKKDVMTWKNIVVIAASFAVVCALAFTAGKMDWLHNNQVLQAGMQSIFSVEEKETSSVNTDAERVYELFLNYSVVIYEVNEFSQEKGISYLQKLEDCGRELSVAERDELVGGVLGKQYILKDSMEEFDDAKNYVAIFGNDCSVCFVIDSETYIYIESVSGLQSLAWN